MDYAKIKGTASQSMNRSGLKLFLGYFSRVALVGVGAILKQTYPHHEFLSTRKP